MSNIDQAFLMLPANYSYTVCRLEKTEWAEILLRFDDASIYQTTSYADVHWGRRNVLHLVLRYQGSIAAICQVVILKIPLLNIGIAYSMWGPMWKIRGGIHDADVLKNIIRALKEEFVCRQNLLLRLVPHEVNEEKNNIKAILENEKLRESKNKSYIYRTIILDLTCDLVDLRKSLKQKWRNCLNKAERNNLCVEEGCSEELYNCFLILYESMKSRKNFESGVNVYDFHNIQVDLPDTVKMKIFVCRYNDTPIAASICSAMGNTGIYLLGASNEKGMELNGSYLLQWKMIEYLKTNGFKWYDLGGIDKIKNPGVYHFKAGLSGIEREYYGRYELYNRYSNLMIFNTGEKIYQRVKKTINRIKGLLEIRK